MIKLIKKILEKIKTSKIRRVVNYMAKHKDVIDAYLDKLIEANNTKKEGK